MVSSTFPISLLDATCIPPLGCKPPKAQGRRLQADVVVRAQMGDDDAFSDLYLKHKRRVFAICMRMVRDFALAEDLTQEAFLHVHRKIASFRGDSAFSTWLHRLAVNTVLMHLRKHALSVVSLDHLMEDVPEERAGRTFGARDLTQAGVADRVDIDRAIAAMAPGYRSVFLLHDIHGFDHGEIADILKCTRGNTKSQLHKARRVVRNVLAPKAGSAGPADNLLLMPSRAGMPNRTTKPQDAGVLRA
jgi:RNA polymerase sigma-70 factor (ECF subfamily)